MAIIIDYSNYHQPPHSELPNVLQDLLSKLTQQHYGELYENPAGSDVSLESAFKSVLETFEGLDHSLCHARYVWMAVLLGFAVKPTVEAYLKDDDRPEIAIAAALAQLAQAHSSLIIESTLKRVKSTLDQSTSVQRSLLGKSLSSSELIDELFPVLSEGCQALDEGLDVFRNILRALDRKQSQLVLLEILDECFEGYAIFPGASSERREIFDWWLREIIPAAWNLQLPKYLLTLKGLQTLDALIPSVEAGLAEGIADGTD